MLHLLIWLAACGVLPPVGSDDKDSPADTDPTGTETDAETDPGALDSGGPCNPGERLDCDGHCADGTWFGDGTCDDGTGRDADFACAMRGWDGGDCADRIPACGNGRLDPGEQCDDNNLTADDGCSPTCRDEVCGDGVQQRDEACDDGNTFDGDACPSDCGFCADDVLEDDDTRLTGTVTAGRPNFSALRTCPTDDDWFLLDLQPGDRLRALATFNAQEGNLDLALYDVANAAVANAATSGDDEELLHTVTSAGQHALRVRLQTDAGIVRGNDYALDLAVSTCVADAQEDDDTPATAALPASFPYTAGLSSCLGDDDFVRLDLLAQQRLTAEATYGAVEGDLRLELTDLIGNVLRPATRSAGRESLVYDAPTSGPVLLRVRLNEDLGIDAGVSYDLSVSTAVCQDDAREPDDVTAGLNLTALPLAAPGLVACPSDLDHVALALTTGGTVQAGVIWDPAEGGLRTELLSPTGSVVATASGQAGNRTLSHTPTTTGTYHLRVTLDGDPGGLVGVPYELNVTASQCPVDPYEDNDARTTPAAITLPFSAAGLGSCNGDEDWFAFPQVAGDQLRVNATFLHAEGDIDIYVVDPAGNTHASSVSTSDNESVTTSVDETGTWYVRVRLVSDRGTVPGNTYDLSVESSPCVADAHEDDDAPGAAPWPGGGTYAWNACHGDPDHVDVPMGVGDVLTAEIGWTTGEGDLQLEVIDRAGTVVRSSSSDIGSRDLTWIPSVAGTYSVRVRSLSDRGPVPGTAYTLSLGLSACPTDAHEEDDSAATGTLVTSPYTASALQACEHDPDVYKIPAQVGQRIWARVTFTDADGDIDLVLKNAAGSSVRTTSGFTDVEELSWTVTTAGEHTLWVENDTDDAVAGVAYTVEIRVDDCPADAREDDDNAVLAALVSPPLAASLTACPNDEDWFRLDLLVGDWVEATVLHDAAEGDVDLSLRNPNGSTVDSGGTIPGGERLSYVVTTAGVHDLIAEQQSDAGPFEGSTYDLELLRLRCEDDPLEPNDDSLTATDATGGLSRAAVTACNTDDDWFAIPLLTGQVVTVDAFFTDAEGDIDLRLVNPALNTVRTAVSSTDNEQLSYTATADGTYLLRVYLASDGGMVPGNPYDLQIVVR